MKYIDDLGQKSVQRKFTTISNEDKLQMEEFQFRFVFKEFS